MATTDFWHVHFLVTDHVCINTKSQLLLSHMKAPPPPPKKNYNLEHPLLLLTIFWSDFQMKYTHVETCMLCMHIQYNQD
jgi:hypothetical protein